MADRNLQIRIGVTLGNTQAQLKALNTNIKNTQSAFKNAGTGIKDFEKTTTGMKAKVEMLSKTMTDLQNKSNVLKKAMSSTEDTLKSVTKAYQNQEKEVNSLKAQLEEYKKVYGENSQAVKALEKELVSAEKELKRLENAVISSDNKLTNLETQLNNVESELKDVTNQFGEASRALSTAKFTEVGTKLQNVGNSMKGVGEAITGVGRNLSIVSAATTGVGVAAIKMASSFESGMSQVKAISRASSEDMERLSEKAREMGKQTSFSATEAADGLKYMALAGWDVDSMLDGLEPILRAAEAGAIDLGRASDLVTDSMGALGLQVEDLTGYLDKVSLASNISNQSLEQTLEAMINVGGVSQTLGIEVEELGAALGILANNGTKGAEAGTKLNSIITRMTAQSTQAQKAWESLGVQVFDAEGNFRGLTTILEETRKAMTGLSEEEQQYFLKQAVGTDNLNDFKFLLEGTTGQLQSYTEQLGNSNGALNEMASTMKDNLQGRIETLMSSISDIVKLFLGTSLDYL